MGNIIPPDSHKGQEIEDFANTILTTFASEYRTTYGCEVLRFDEESEECKYPFSLKFCPWERLDYPLKKGYLTKQGFIRRSWRKRYFVVQPNFLIDYYESEEAFEKGLKPKGTINPCGYQAVSDLEDVLAKRHKKLTAMLGADRPDTPETFPNHTFGVVHDKARSYFITAENEQEKLEWVQMFQLCCACVKGFNIDDPICQSTFNKAIARTLRAYGNTEYHNYRGTEEKVLCDMITSEIESRFLIGIYRNVKGNMAAKIKIRDQVLKALDVSVQARVSNLWGILMGDKDKTQLKSEALLREKKAEIAAVRRKVEWEMNGQTETYIKEALTEVRNYVQKIFPVLEKSILDALCEVRDIYQTNIVEIAVDVEQREEVEIPVQMYINSLDMLARTPSEMEVAYKHLEEMEKVLEDAHNDLKSFQVSTLLLQAQEKLRMVMDALVNTFQERFLSLSRDIKGKQKHKQLRNLIEEVDQEVTNNLETDLNEIINTFNLRTLKTIFVSYVHKQVDGNCKRVIESVDDVIPGHLRFVLTLDNEYERLVERSVEQLLKEVMNIMDESKQRSFSSSMRSSGSRTFPKFSSRRTKFQTGSKRSEATTCVSLPVKPNGVTKEHDRKSSLSKIITFGCLAINGDCRKSSGYTDITNNSADDSMVEISLNLNAQHGGNETKG